MICLTTISKDCEKSNKLKLNVIISVMYWRTFIAFLSVSEVLILIYYAYYRLRRNTYVIWLSHILVLENWDLIIND